MLDVFIYMYVNTKLISLISLYFALFNVATGKLDVTLCRSYCSSHNIAIQDSTVLEFQSCN